MLMAPETTIPVPSKPNPKDLLAEIKALTTPAFCRPAANSAATKINDTTFVSMVPMPLKKELASWKTVFKSRRHTASTNNAVHQPITMAQATESTMEPETVLLKISNRTIGTSGSKA